MLIQVLEMRRTDHPQEEIPERKSIPSGRTRSQPDLASLKTTVSLRIFLITVFRCMKKLKRDLPAY
jgi:hypothetical protein